MKRIINTIQFYVLATSLKEKIRSGWINWHIKKERLESVAEHIYGTCILAIAIDSEYELNIDLNRVLKMLVLHELEEVIIGDITPYDNVSEENKIIMGKEAVKSILGDMVKCEEYELLLDEFNSHQTSDSSFAFMCDKLEADLQAKIYTEGNYCDIYSDINKDLLERDWNKKSLENGAKSLSDLFINYDIRHFDHLFTSIALYIKENDIKNY